ncbi:37S ribosomal protein S24, mitochondrial [Knufia fluminis]|uniref:37S ribosomal protein S24, mitochondrial n=1 Tax=Knufia fluminis TaxID=191047 RepID=A0AAN8EFD4_9EURO|nr:37S ribosomal protein S24, mitochondrial [Knufia fluminis]
MATASRHLCRTLLRTLSQPTARRPCQSIPRQRIQPPPFRQLSSIPVRRAEVKGETAEADSKAEAETERDDGISADFNENELQTPAQPYTVADLDADERAHYETLSKDDQNQYMAVQNHVKAIMESEEVQTIAEDQARVAARQIERTGINPNFLEERNLQALKDGYWQEDEDDEFGVVPDDDDEFSEDLITSVAESQLEVHREVREYTRIAAWELPGLLQFTKPFDLPDMKKSPLRFRYTTYMGETHPAQKKVVLEFTTKEVAAAAGLSEAQRIKLVKLIGVRYNPDKDLAKMSCEQFENQAQNKRYLGDLVQKLVTQAKDKTDMFEDVPLDFRHHKPKKIVPFPEAWKVGSEQAVKRLAEGRGSIGLLEEGQRPVNGREMVEEYVRSKSIQPAFGAGF